MRWVKLLVEEKTQLAVDACIKRGLEAGLTHEQAGDALLQAGLTAGVVKVKRAKAKGKK